MLLIGARVAIDATESVKTDLLIRSGRVFMGRTAPYQRKVDLSGLLILPGLINAHDHLDLNLFPRLGRGPYKSATVWAEDIFRPDESPVKEHLRVPKPVRLVWGGIKNLLSGVTCVAHHNPYAPEVFNRSFPVRVLRRYGWAHSIHFSPDWQMHFRRTPRHYPFIIHLAEGTDEQSRRELYDLDAGRALAPSTVLVHAVGLELADLEILRRRKASLIWCPTSNVFTLGRTIRPGILFSGLPIALGTDSALTAKGDLIDELQTATEAVELPRLYGMVTSAPARILRLETGAGYIMNAGPADLLVVRDHGQSPAEALGSFRLEAVFVNGKLKLVSESTAERFPSREIAGYETLSVEGRGRFRLPFEISKLISITQQALGGAMFRLAGKAVSA